jgi:hypothetical protein
VRDPEGAEQEAAEDESRLVWAPMWPLRILHFPVRSSDQFKRRTEVAIFEGHYPDWGRFKRLREIYEQGRFEELYEELVLDDAAVEEGIREGRLVTDERFARLLERCPDPLEGGEPGAVRVEASSEAMEAERSDLEFDAMQLLARTSRWTSLQRERGRERSESLMEDVKKTTKQRDFVRRKVKRMDRRLETKKKRLADLERRLRRRRAMFKDLRKKLNRERRRPWSRVRRVILGVARRGRRALRG